MSDDNLSQLNADELKRYQRHFALPNFGQKAQLLLKKSKVLVVGAGGLGSPVLLYLAASGVGELGIIDFDTIDESNLQRQVLFNTEDIGLHKASSARQKIKKLNPNVKTTVFNHQLSVDNALDIIEAYDLVIDGTDNFPTRYLINDACVILDKPFIYGSIFRYEGQVAVFNYENGPNYRDLYPTPPDPDSVPNCAEGGVLGVLPGIVGSIQASEAIKIITSVGEVLAGKLYIIDLLTLGNQKITIPKNPDTPPIEQLINYDELCGINKSKPSMVKEITVQELKQMLDEGADHQLIDVREAHEYDIANLNGELIPLGQIPDAQDQISKDKKVIIHCRSGARSAQAVQYLQQKLATENLYNLKGGILAWADQIDPTMAKY